MSDRDFMNFDDEALDSGASGEWDADLLEGFPEDDPAAMDEAAAPSAAQTASAAAGKQKPDEAAKKPRQHKPRRQGSAGGGFLVFLLVMLAGVTLSLGLLTATGAQPEMLLDFSGFTDPMTIGDFRTHPINAFWLSALVTLALATLAAVAVRRRVGGLSSTGAMDADKLAAMTQLDPERPETWQDERLQNDPDLAPVVSNLLGHYNLQQAKLMRYVDLEGELHRLEAALADENLDDLAGNWENPSAGSLADQATRMLKASQEADLEVNNRMQGFDEHGPDLVTGLRDARAWNQSTLESVTQHGAAAERLARGLARMVEQLPDEQQKHLQLDRVRQALVAVKSELANLPARGAEKRRDLEAPLTTLVERASRLAFQIAMEVARLGAKGERLLPLTQDLEELTTELRKTTEGHGREAEDDPRDRALENVRGRLAELDPSALEGLGKPDAEGGVSELSPLAGQSAQALAQLARSFNVQTARIVQMLNVMGELTGLDVGGTGDPNAEPGSSMAVEQFDPFGSESASDSGLVADPFASASSDSIFDVPAPDAGDFGQGVLPDTDQPAAPLEPGLMDLGSSDPVPAAAESLPSADETVYDLNEFDALKLESEPAAEPDEPIYELSAFGAERIS